MTRNADLAVVHVVDDDEQVREGLLRLLSAVGYQARGYASAGEFLISGLDGTRGCVLLDVRMPGPSGLDLQRALKERAHNLPVVFLTGHGDVPMCARALKEGAVDFLTKPVQKDDLLAAIEAALTQEAQRHNAHTHASELRVRFEQLSERERSVAIGIVAGRLNKQIAADLAVSERTIKSYRAHLMARLGVRSISELSTALKEVGVLEPLAR